MKKQKGADARFAVVKKFILDSNTGSISEALEMLESINQVISRYTQVHNDYCVVRSDINIINFSSVEMLAENEVLGEKIELELQITAEQPKPLPKWTTGLSVRVATCLVDAGFKGVAEVKESDQSGFDFLTIPNFSMRCLLELRDWQERMGIRTTNNELD